MSQLYCRECGLIGAPTELACIRCGATLVTLTASDLAEAQS